MACDILVILITTVAFKIMFSAWTRVIDSYKAALAHQSFIYFHLHRLYQSLCAGIYVILKVSACLVYWFHAHYRGVLLLRWVNMFHAHNLIYTDFWFLKRCSMVLDSANLEPGWYIIWNIWKFTGGFVAKWNGSENWVILVLEDWVISSAQLESISSKQKYCQSWARAKRLRLTQTQVQVVFFWVEAGLSIELLEL